MIQRLRYSRPTIVTSHKSLSVLILFQCHLGLMGGKLIMCGDHGHSFLKVKIQHKLHVRKIEKFNTNYKLIIMRKIERQLPHFPSGRLYAHNAYESSQTAAFGWLKVVETATLCIKQCSLGLGRGGDLGSGGPPPQIRGGGTAHALVLPYIQRSSVVGCA